MADRPAITVPTDQTLQEFLEGVVDMLATGRLPVLRTKYADGQPVNVGFYLVPDYAGICADCRKKVN